MDAAPQQALPSIDWHIASSIHTEQTHTRRKATHHTGYGSGCTQTHEVADTHQPSGADSYSPFAPQYEQDYVK